MAQPRNSLERFILSLGPTTEPGQLISPEVFWRDRYTWLLEHGYRLRPRYSPEWQPSWKGTQKSFLTCEDGWSPPHPVILDAVRLSDNSAVTLKRVSKSLHPDEASIMEYLTTGPLASDPRNHCVPLYEVLEDALDANVRILVMPFLRSFDEPKFDTLGEAIEFFHQLIEGMLFIHENHIAHRDCSHMNIMMDPAMYPELYHPSRTDMKRDLSGRAKHYSRTERPVKYYYIDFGLSKRYNPEDDTPKDLPIRGGDKSVPELQGDRYNTPCDPFAADVYCVGNVIRQEFLNRYEKLQFMESLVGDMVQDDPTKRPAMNEVSRRFTEIAGKLSPWKLRGRLVKRTHGRVIRFVLDVYHVCRTAGYTVRGLPARPRPKPSGRPS